MPTSISGTAGVTIGSGAAYTFGDGSTQTSAADPADFGFKNRIINGAMVIDQRNAGASVTPANEQYTLDRWQAWRSQASKYSVQQNAGSVTPPAGFSHYLGVTSLSAYSIAVSDYFLISQKVEGFNLSDFAWGTASAQAVTLSFWVRSSLTGTFGGSVQNSAQNRSYPFAYTISVANTWEQKSITIAGDTSGTWLSTNGIGLYLWLGLGVGSNISGTAGAWAGSSLFSATGATSVVGTNGATFYITGVQLEKNTGATGFDVRPYGTELALCQRYYCKEQANAIGNLLATGFCDATTTTTNYFLFPVTMRTNPTALEQSGTAGDYSVLNSSGASVACSAVPTFSSATTKAARFIATVASGLTGGNGTMVRAASTNAYLAFSAEL